MFDNKSLKWKVIKEKELFKNNILSIIESKQEGYNGLVSNFTMLNTGDCVNVVSILKEKDKEYFVMVRQYRHACNKICLEFPGGLLNKEENPEDGIIREFKEETGYKLEILEKIAEFSPIAAFLKNKFHVYYGEIKDKNASDLNLDENEFLQVKLIEKDKLLLEEEFFNNGIILSMYTAYLAYKQKKG